MHDPACAHVRRSRLARHHRPFFGYGLLMCFSAVLLDHHDVIDALRGAACVAAPCLAVEEVVWRRHGASAAGVTPGRAVARGT